MYSEDEYLQLSGLQHFSFCRRQWALIHIEGFWEDNYRTVSGSLMHSRAHCPKLSINNENIIIARSVNVFSSTLGVSGQCDIIEFHKDENGISLMGHLGYWLPYPIEYKRGAPRDDKSDELQLCCQAMCLEEMLCCDILRGAIYYGEIRRRVEVFFSEELRFKVKNLLNEMHNMYKRNYTPKVKFSKSCEACSLYDFCLPEIMKFYNVSEYLMKRISEEK